MFFTKNISRIGTWNVRTMNKPGSLKQVVQEMAEYKLEQEHTRGIASDNHRLGDTLEALLQTITDLRTNR